jgi:integration host factor subunit beta
LDRLVRFYSPADILVVEKYTKIEIIDSLCEKTGISRKEIRTVIDNFIGELKDGLVKNKVIELRGFGTFEIKVRKGRKKARNPRTGEIVSVGSHGTVIFRPGRDLKQDVWNLGFPQNNIQE